MDDGATVLVDLRWSGPHGFLPGAPDSVFQGPVAEQSGLYLWTVQRPNGFLVHYVGQTEKSFGLRHLQHLREYWGGAYTIHQAAAFLDGRRNELYRGYGYRGDAWRQIEPFVREHETLLSELRAMLSGIKIFLAPLAAPRRIHRRVEGAIVELLYRAGGEIGDFQEPGMRREPRRLDEAVIRVRSVSPCLLLGIPAEFEA